MQRQLELHPFLKAVQDGKLLEVRSMLFDSPIGSHKFIRGPEGETALHLAVQHGHADIVRYLLAFENGRSVHLHQNRIQDNAGQVPFSYLKKSPSIEKSSSIEIACCLLDEGAPFDAKVWEFGRRDPFKSVLANSALVKGTELEKLLTKITTLFELAEKPEQFDACQKLFNELNTLSPKKNVVNWVNEKGETLLHIAAKKGNLPLAKLLRQHNAIDQHNLELQLAIQLAIVHNRVDVLEFFISELMHPNDINLSSYCTAESKESAELIKAYETALNLIGSKKENCHSELKAILTRYPKAGHWGMHHYPYSMNLLTKTIFDEIDVESAQLLCEYGNKFDEGCLNIFIHKHSSSLDKAFNNIPAVKQLLTLMFTHNSAIYELESIRSLLEAIAFNGKDDLLEFVCEFKEVKICLNPELISELLSSAVRGANSENIVLLVEKYKADLHAFNEKTQGVLSHLFKGYDLDDDIGDSKDLTKEEKDRVRANVDIRFLKIIKFLVAHRVILKKSPLHGKFSLEFTMSAAYLLNMGYPLSNFSKAELEPTTKEYVQCFSNLFDAAEDDKMSLDDFKKLFIQATQHPIQQKLKATLLSLDQKPAALSLSLESKGEKKEEKVSSSLDESDDDETVFLQWVNSEDMNLFHYAAKRLHKMQAPLELHEAQNQVGILKFLLDQGFDPKKKNAAQKTAEDLAGEASPESLNAYYFAMGCHLLEKFDEERPMNAVEYFIKIEKSSHFYLAACEELHTLLSINAISFDGSKYVRGKEKESHEEFLDRMQKDIKLCNTISELSKDEKNIEAIEKRIKQSLREVSKFSHKRKHEEDKTEPTDAKQDENAMNTTDDEDSSNHLPKRSRLGSTSREEKTVPKNTTGDSSAQSTPLTPSVSLASSSITFLSARPRSPEPTPSLTSTLPDDDIDMSTGASIQVPKKS